MVIHHKLAGEPDRYIREEGKCTANIVRTMILNKSNMKCILY